MGEILIMLKDNLDPNTATRYLKGDPVECRDDGFQWGTDMEYFGVLKIPGLSCSIIKKYMTSEYEDDNKTIKRRRIWRFLIDSVPTAVKQEFMQNREYTATIAQVKNFIQNKITLLGDDDLDG